MSASGLEQVRRFLRKRDGDLCWLCGEAFTGRRRRHRTVTLDHVIPKSAGGNRHPSNLRLAHQVCNRLRGTAPATEAPALVKHLLAEARAKVDGQ